MTDIALLARTVMEELAAAPERLGLAVQLRPGTALYDTDPVAETAVVLDGDEQPCYCISLVGPMTAGARPQVLFLPPHGAYIVGLAADIEWRALPLTGGSGWTNFGGGEQVAQFRRVGWQTELRGLVKRSATTNTQIGTLPDGFRPVSQRFFSAPNGASHTRVDVTELGLVLAPFLTAAAVAGELGLDVVKFGFDS